MIRYHFVKVHSNSDQGRQILSTKCLPQLRGVLSRQGKHDSTKAADHAGWSCRMTAGMGRQSTLLLLYCLAFRHRCCHVSSEHASGASILHIQADERHRQQLLDTSDHKDLSKVSEAEWVGRLGGCGGIVSSVCSISFRTLTEAACNSRQAALTPRTCPRSQRQHEAC